MSETLEQLQTAVITGEPDQARELAAQALEAGVVPLTAIEQALNPGMQVVGDRFEYGEYFIPDLVMAAEAMKAAMAVLEPALVARQEQRQVAGTVVIGTVEGDIHEIGKSLVGTMLAAAGFQVYDLGVDVPAGEFVIEALKEAGLRQQVQVIIGGAPTSPEWAQTIGADAYAENANEAVAVVRELLGNDNGGKIGVGM
jgi:methanogenic corrinoid protein MtbC1